MKENDNTRVYIITHKEFNMLYPKNYMPIQVGKNNTKLELPYESDDSGDNIAFKNPNYCELTGIYWILKNCNLKEYIGIVHYRRYISKNTLIKKLIDGKSINKILKKYDIILPNKFFFPRKVWNNYYEAGSGKEIDLIKLKNIITTDYPDYIDAFNKIVNSNSASYCNMLITSKVLFKEYHEWLFEVLSKLEKKVDLSNYTKSEARIYGYLSEILLNVWVEKKGLKIKYLPILFTDYNFKDEIKWKLKMIKGRIWGLRHV